ncbi:ComEC/Rec2 family competence protein [Candidatus Gracilibacteria bacterium]|nr:ComEC/Rec2 family competence protein [Candidatus Gracilibacteria bacterium]
MYFLLSFLTGIFIGDVWFETGIWLVVFLILISSVFFWKNWKALLCIALLLLAGYIFAVHAYQSLQERREKLGSLVGWDGPTRSISGIAGDLLSVSEFSHKYRVTVSHIDEEILEKPLDISVSMPPNLSLLPGDSVTAFGRFSFPQDTPDYQAEKQLSNRKIIAEFRSFTVHKIPPEKYNIFIRMRIWFDQQLTEIFPARGRDILGGIILGQKNNLDAELKEDLKASGLMHIMVVSGSNVMMLIIFLSLFLRSVTPWIRIALITCTIGGFVLLVGGDTPVWRAALMGIIGYSASLWGYRFSPLLLPLIVAVILAFLNPLSLAYDIGLQLSFLSVICIISFGKQLTKFFGFLGSFFDEAMSLTVAATIGTFPITLFYFGTFSLVGPLANLLAAPAIPVLMYGGIAALLVSSFSTSLAYFIGYIPWFAVTYLSEVISLFGSQRWSLLPIELGQYREEFMVISLGFLALGLVHFQRSHQSQFTVSKGSSSS